MNKNKVNNYNNKYISDLDWEKYYFIIATSEW